MYIYTRTLYMIDHTFLIAHAAELAGISVDRRIDCCLAP